MNAYLILAAILFSIGLFGVITRRHVIGILMSVELMLNASNINFVLFNRYLANDGVFGQGFAISIMLVAVAEVSVALAIGILVYRRWQGNETDLYGAICWRESAAGKSKQTS